MQRSFIGLALFGASLGASVHASAETALLIAVGDSTQLTGLELAKVMADDSSLWLRARLKGRTRLALVTAEACVESAPAAHEWLAALDFATRIRVAAPPGPLSGCGASQAFDLADSGLPEPRRIAALETSSASSELDLRRRLVDAELPVDVARVAEFASRVQPPFRLVIYDVPAFGGSTEALRLFDRGHPAELPPIELSGMNAVPVSLIALAQAGVLPLAEESADPSEFPVTYRAPDAQSDYLSARGGWLAQNSGLWLNEVQQSAALFAATAWPTGSPSESVISHYFGQLSGKPAGSCEAQIRAARAGASLNPADFVCGGADDLARSLSEVGFAELRLSRLFGMASADGPKFRIAPSEPRSPLLLATDFDPSGCPNAVAMLAGAPSSPPDSTSSPPVSAPPVVVSTPDDPEYGRAPVATVTVFDAGPNDSCSGDSSVSDSSTDSCSGDSSSSDSSTDSCSGDSSSDSSGSDSCSGDSSDSNSDSCSGDSDSSSDSSGCGKSGYDGDTCSGNSASGSPAPAKSAARGEGSAAAHPRPRQVRLSLLTLLAAALALPLRRLRASR